MNDDDLGLAPPPWVGLPQTAHSALTPSGQIEQATKVAEGFRQRRAGWRRVVFVTGVVVVALMAVFMLLFAVVSATQR